MFWWQVENVLMKRSKYGKVNAIKKNDIASIGLVSKKLKISGDKVKVVTSFIFIFSSLMALRHFALLKILVIRKSFKYQLLQMLHEDPHLANLHFVFSHLCFSYFKSVENMIARSS